MLPFAFRLRFLDTTVPFCYDTSCLMGGGVNIPRDVLFKGGLVWRAWVDEW